MECKESTRKKILSRIKPYPNPIRLPSDARYSSTKIKVAFVAGEDVQGRSLDDVQQLTKQVRRYGLQPAWVRSSEICTSAEAALPVTIDFEAHFCKTLSDVDLTWGMACSAGASGCEGKAGGFRQKPCSEIVWPMTTLMNIGWNIFPSSSEVGLAAAVFTLYQLLFGLLWE